MTSLSQRLTLSIAVGFFLMTGSLGTFIYFRVTQHTLSQLDSRLQTLGSTFSHAFEFEPESPEAPYEFDFEVSKFPEFSDSNVGSCFELHLENNGRIAHSPSLVNREFGIVPDWESQEWKYTFIALPNGNTGRLLQFATKPRVDAEDIREKITTQLKRGFILVAIDAREYEKIQAFLLWTFVLAIPVLFALSYLLARWIAQHGLKPVEAIGRNVQELGDFDSANPLSMEGLPRELVPLANAINELLSRIQTTLRKERQLNQAIAHELRTPVTELLTGLEITSRWPEATQAKEISSLLASAQRLSRLIESLTTLGQVQNGQTQLQEAHICIVQTTQIVISRYQAIIDRKGLQVSYSDLESLEVYISRPLFEIIVENLIKNACEYAPLNSSVLIEFAKSENVLIRISNQAPALKFEDLNRLFDPWWRVDPARASQKHSGLGLSIALAAAKALDADLTPNIKNGILSMEFQLRNDGGKLTEREVA